jgi:hypothetical protein
MVLRLIMIIFGRRAVVRARAFVVKNKSLVITTTIVLCLLAQLPYPILDRLFGCFLGAIMAYTLLGVPLFLVYCLLLYLNSFGISVRAELRRLAWYSAPLILALSSLYLIGFYPLSFFYFVLRVLSLIFKPFGNTCKFIRRTVVFFFRKMLGRVGPGESCRAVTPTWVVRLYSRFWKKP